MSRREVEYSGDKVREEVVWRMERENRSGMVKRNRRVWFGMAMVLDGEWERRIDRGVEWEGE